MRPSPTYLALLLALQVPAAHATVAVDTLSRTVESSQFRLRFGTDDPDRVVELVWKPWNPAQNLAAQDAGGTNEFFGQSMSDLSGPPLVDPTLLSEQAWAATLPTHSQVTVTCTTRSEGGPRFVTRYLITDDQPWFEVTRTIDFSDAPATTTYQPFVPRLAPVGPYRAVRWRDRDGVVRLGGLCFAGCLEPAWDETWSEIELQVGGTGVAVALLSLAGTPPASGLVTGYGPATNGVWAAPQHPAGGAAVESHRFALRFSLTAGQVGALDSLRAAIDAPFLGAPPAAPGPLALSVGPAPARGETRIAFTLPNPGRFRLEVFDASGRRVETLADGHWPAGTHGLRWSVPPSPGLYFLRARTATAEATRRLVVTR